MKKIRSFTLIAITSVLIAIGTIISCSSSPPVPTEESYIPYATPVFKTNWGTVYKYRDGNNDIYIYERASGASGITVK